MESKLMTKEVKTNIVLDFTQGLDDLAKDQPLAIMPAELAQKALRILAQHMGSASFYDIKMDIIEAMRSTDDIDQLKETMLLFLQERMLITNILAENWKAYDI